MTSPYSYDDGDVVLDGRGYAYLFQGYDTTSNGVIVKLADHSQSYGPGYGLQTGPRVKPVFDPVHSKLYMLGLYNDGIKEVSATAGVVSGGTSWWWSDQHSGPFLSPDGARVYGGSGDVWSPTTLTTVASLLGPGETATFECIQDSTVAGRILAARTYGYDQDAFRVYDRSLLAAPVKKYAPEVIVNGTALGTIVRWVFWKPDGSGYYVVGETFDSKTPIAEY